MFFILITVSIVFGTILAAPQNDPSPRPNDLKPGNYYFTADWCNYCQEQAPIIKQLQDQGFNIQIYNDPDIFKNLNIRELPTIIVIRINERGKQIVIRLKGKQPIKKLVKILIKEEKDGQEEMD